MKAPFGLRLYPLGQRREPGAEAASWPQRTTGALAWLHVPGPASGPAMQELARRLIDEDGLAVLMTGAADLPVEKGVVRVDPPADTPAMARAFLDHWRPDIAIFSDGELLPAVIQEAADRRIPLILADAREPRLPRERDSWFPGLMRRSLAQFAHVACIDEASARAFRKAGAALSAVAVTGRMEARSAALPCLEAEREALARLMAARPVWFACAVPEAEEAAVLEAQRAVAATAHRLLLILLPEKAARAEPLARAIEDAGLAVALRSADEEPEAETAVFVVRPRPSLACGTGLPRSPSLAAAFRGSAPCATRWRRRRWDRPSCTGRVRACTAWPWAGWARHGRRGPWGRPATWPRRWATCWPPTGPLGLPMPPGAWPRTGPRRPMPCMPASAA